LKAGTTTFTYDGNGNQLTKTTGAGTATYGWDALNRLISLTGAGLNTQYQYDGDGNRVKQQIGANAYQYSNDTVTALPVVMNENGPDGNIDYVNGHSLISATSPTFQSFYQFDGLGSVANVTNQAGTLTANYAYDPWGQAIMPVAPPFGLDTLGTKNKYKFTERHWTRAMPCCFCGHDITIQLSGDLSAVIHCLDLLNCRAAGTDMNMLYRTRWG